MKYFAYFVFRIDIRMDMQNVNLDRTELETPICLLVLVVSFLLSSVM